MDGRTSPYHRSSHRSKLSKRGYEMAWVQPSINFHWSFSNISESRVPHICFNLGGPVSSNREVSVHRTMEVLKYKKVKMPRSTRVSNHKSQTSSSIEMIVTCYITWHNWRIHTPKNRKRSISFTIGQRRLFLMILREEPAREEKDSKRREVETRDYFKPSLLSFLQQNFLSDQPFLLDFLIWSKHVRSTLFKY